MLNHLIKDRRDLSWKIEPLFMDGTDNAIFEILIFEIKSNMTLARIAFQEYSGMLLRMKAKGMRNPKAKNIVDALLDVMSLDMETTYSKSISV